MFVINEDLSIYATRGDIVHIAVSLESKGEPYNFQAGDIVRIKIFGKKDCSDVVLQKDFPVTTESETVEIFLTSADTRIGGVINKHSDYWYEIELNPDTNPQTIIGYDDDGAKIFRLFPEGRNLDIEAPEIEPEDIPIIDVELDATSLRPVQNQAIVRGIERTAQRVTKDLEAKIKVNKDGFENLEEKINRFNKCLYLNEGDWIQDGMSFVVKNAALYNFFVLTSQDEDANPVFLIRAGDVLWGDTSYYKELNEQGLIEDTFEIFVRIHATKENPSDLDETWTIKSKRIARGYNGEIFANLNKMFTAVYGIF